MDLLNLHQPWDCERFPKSKTICYGGSAPEPVKKVVKKVADQSGYTGSDLDKAGQATEKAITGGVKKVAETAKEVVAEPPPILKKASEGFDEFGRRIKKDVSGSIEDLKKGASSTIESVKSDIARSDLGSGAVEEAVKKSDLGTISNQAKDVLNAPGAYIGKKAEEFKQYAMDRAGVKDPRDQMQQVLDSTTEAVKNKVKQQKPNQGPGGGKTVGQGGVEGLKGGGSLAASERSRIRQNKRKLRIART